MTIDYGTEVTEEDIERLSVVDSIARISMKYAGPKETQIGEHDGKPLGY